LSTSGAAEKRSPSLQQRPGPACSTRSWRPQPRDPGSTPASPRCASRSTGSRGVKALEAPAGLPRRNFGPTQCEGLGWLDYLQQFRVSAASSPTDMGLGKTIQVPRAAPNGGGRGGRRRGRPWASSPRSPRLQTGSPEASKFTPRLRVLDYNRARNRHGPPRRVRPVRPDHHHLRHPPHRHHGAWAVRVRLRDPRRGARRSRTAESQAAKAARLPSVAGIAWR